jgi:phosphoglycerate dehydrogenase-like enzyme
MMAIPDIWLVDDLARELRADLARLLSGSIESHLRLGEPTGVDDAIIAGKALPLESVELRRASGILLLAPALDERDRVQTALAGREWTWLSVVPDPAPAVQAERSLALLYGLATGILPPRSADSRGESPAPDGDLAPLLGRRLGLLGFGPLAWEMAVRLAAAGMEIAYWSDPPDTRRAAEELLWAARTGAYSVAFDELLRSSDVVALDVEDGYDGSPLIGAAELASMREDALIVNTNAPRAIDEGALIQALRGGYFRGVALDRFNFEPLPADSPLRRFERVLLTPGITRPGAELVRQLLAEAAARALERQAGLPLVARRVRRVMRRISGS